MTNSTETYWDVDGTSLQTLAFNIQTLGGDRLAPPPVRGANITVPYAAGQVWVPKVPDQRVLTLGMWVIGANEDGTIPQNEDSRRTFDANWSKLRTLLWQYRKQFTLTKRFWVPTADLTAAGEAAQAIETQGSWSLIKAATKASFGGGLVPAMGGTSSARFTVDLVLADPYFYSEEIEIEFSINSGGSLPGPNQSFTVLGDDRTHAITAHLEGPLTTPQLELSSDTVEPWMKYNALIEDGDKVDIDVKAFSAKHTQSLTTFGAAGNMRNYGDRNWFYLDPGSAIVALSAQAGTGTASLAYQPAWL